MPRAKKKDEEAQEKLVLEDEEVPSRRKTRQSTAAAALTPTTVSKTPRSTHKKRSKADVEVVTVSDSDDSVVIVDSRGTPKSISKTPKKLKKLNKNDIEKELMSDSGDESAASESSRKSVGKNENDFSNYEMDDQSITMKIKRMPGQINYKVAEFKLGVKKKDETPVNLSETLGRTRNRKSMYQSLQEDKLLRQEVTRERSTSISTRKNKQVIPKTPTKRPPNPQSEWESASEVDENIMPNANLSPKRSKVIESRQITNTPVKSRTAGITNTPKKVKTPAYACTPSKARTIAIVDTPTKTRTPRKSTISSLSLQSPTKAFGKLQIGTPKTRKSTKPLESNTNTQNSTRRYEFRSKRTNAMYAEFSSNSESGDDGDKDFASEDDPVSSEDEEDEEEGASDVSDEMYNPKKTKSKKVSAALMKTPSKSNLRTPSKVSMETPTKLISRMSLNSLTPSVHRRTINIVKPSTPLQEARQKLHVSVLPKSLPCREEEFNNIYTFLHARLSDLSGGCIYVSGVPGTGKTATVNEVIRCLRKSVNAGKLDEFEFVEVNGMRLSEPRQAYVQIWKQLSGNQTTWEVAQKSLHDRFTTANSKRGMTLLLVDELDLLCTKRQDVVYNLLDWPSKSTAKLVVVTIANTMDLPERILMGKVTSRLGLTRLTFPPYNHKQLEEIVVSRLKGHNAFSGETVQLVARKVAAVSGDARRALDICRRATEVAEMNDREMVTMMDVKRALDEMIATPKIQAIKACSDMEKIFLQAVCTEVNRTGVEEVLFKNVYFQIETLCAFEGEKLPNVTEALSMCARLGAWRLLLCDHSRLDIHQRLLLNVSTDDVYFAIKNVTD